MNSTNIRPASEKDRDKISTISSSVEIIKTWQMDQSMEDGILTTRFREVPLPRAVRLGYQATSRLIRSNLENNDLSLVAEEDSNLIGFLSLAIGSNGVHGRVTDLVVAEEKRNKGIATSLLISAEDWLQERKVKEIILEMMLKNTPAINFCRKLGFEFCGFHDVYFANGQTAIFFHRKIN